MVHTQERNIYKKLNPPQQKAVQTTDGPLLIIAGPGAGKTMTLVERVVYLIQEKKLQPEQLMVATFTEKAAKELTTRISNRLLGLDIRVNLNEMYIGTLHSIFLRLLEEYREFTHLKRNFRLLDQFDQQYFIFNQIHDYLHLDDVDTIINSNGSNWRKAQAILGYINKIGEENLDIEILRNAPEPEIRALGALYQTYTEKLQDENALDFSRIQVEALELLLKNPQVVAELQDKIQYFMIDEYQDTNTIQEKILLLLSDRSKNICVVGDDDQGLYRFRGATIRNILEFPQNFSPGTCKEIILSTNYRSHPDIVEFYNDWMTQQNWKEGGKSFRHNKTIQPHEGNFPSIPTVIKVSAEGSAFNYHQEVLDFIRHLEKRNVLSDYNQLAFLFRSVKNEKVIDLAEFLEENGINVFSPRSALFFEREEIQLLLGAIIFIFPNLFEILKWSDDAYLRVWDYYGACKHRFAEEIRKDKQRHLGLLKWCNQKAKSLLTLSGKTTYGFAALIYQLLEYPMFAQYLNNDLKGSVTNQRAAYNIALLTKLLYKFEFLHHVTVISTGNKEKHLKQLFNFFLRFLYEGGIEEYEDFDDYAPSGCVSFMTIHQSKGLEFPVVLVGSLNSVPRKQYKDVDKILQDKYYHKPTFEPIDQTKYFDFWRLFYTAFSRAQNLLVLTANEKWEGHGKTPSKYLEQSYNKAISWDDNRFKVQELSLAEIKPTKLKKEYSFTSHILLYENCPLQYKFYKELEFTEVRTGGVIGGTLLHQTIEDIHKAVLRGEEHKVNDENIEVWFNTNYQLLVKQERSYLAPGQQKALLNQVIRYKDRMKHQWHTIKEAEVDVSLVKEDYILKGTIDLIRGENETVELIDFKSGDKPDVNDTDPHNRNALNGFRRQLEVYAHLIEERTDYKVSKIHLYFPKEELGSPYITFKKDHGHIDQTIASFEQVVNKIERKDFDNSHIVKSEKQCGNCDMRFYCNPNNPKFKT